MTQRSSTTTEKVGMVVVLLIFLGLLLAVNPGWTVVSNWLAGPNASGWAQAVGTVLAIWGAFQISTRQQAEARRLWRRSRTEDALASLEVTSAMFAQAVEMVRLVAEPSFFGRIPSSKARELRNLQSVIDSIRSLPPLDIPAWKVATLVVALPPVLQDLHDALDVDCSEGRVVPSKRVVFRIGLAKTKSAVAHFTATEHAAALMLKLVDKEAA